MQSSQFANQPVAGTQIEMVGVGEDDLRIELFEILLCLALDRRRGPDRHEGRRLDQAVRRPQLSPASAGRIGRENLKMKTHPASVSGEGRCEACRHQSDHQIQDEDPGERSSR